MPAGIFWARRLAAHLAAVILADDFLEDFGVWLGGDLTGRPNNLLREVKDALLTGSVFVAGHAAAG